jgi:hypothetical protein
MKLFALHNKEVLSFSLLRADCFLTGVVEVSLKNYLDYFCKAWLLGQDDLEVLKSSVLVHIFVEKVEGLSRFMTFLVLIYSIVDLLL